MYFKFPYIYIVYIKNDIKLSFFTFHKSNSLTKINGVKSEHVC